MLVAGTTGSGKSVYTNSIIMSILYRATPEEVRLIVIDPKVVEFQVYDGIPHLLIPVVTDPKKAAGALNWAVGEMNSRYNKFAELRVRDLKDYNEKIQSLPVPEGADAPKPLPQIVIIIDELADLMMVAKNEVEASIVRIAQLARAAGIYMIIATQRPSVDVVTGLIKANMPSRTSLRVSTGTDSRVIIDQVGAEKLLGNGDMLFYPAGFKYPERVQGAFVTTEEIEKTVAFLKEQNQKVEYDQTIEESMNAAASASGTESAAMGISDSLDSYFVDAGKYIIDKNKASIGNLQRVFKIGFNRAARIMDQLCDAGVVGEEQGTKPREVLMSMEEFEQYIEDYV
jgi:S-DNA-T family DNA segregation ATPase FtsK/SpoIIIE